MLHREDQLVVEPVAHDETATLSQLAPDRLPRPNKRRYVNITRGQWSDTEVEAMAKAKLALGEVYSVNDV